jgi:UDP-N-acetylmuramoyl-L-alanyl-D-glutamate--2,6-diaminopimelate ligase
MIRTLSEVLSSIQARPSASQLRVANLSTVNGDVPVLNATHDSRQVMPGTIFCCIRGEKSNGHNFAELAVAAGAVALLVDHELTALDVPQIVVDDTRRAMGTVAAAAFGFPADQLLLVGITGTNGKTTTAHMLEQILLADHKTVRVIGTLTQTRTTPEATDLQEQLAAFVREGVDTVVMEVTSHALELWRVAGLHYRVGVFTNLSQDHLDFHGTMEKYFRAKAKLFTAEYVDRAVVNLDDTHGQLLRDAATVPTDGYSISEVSALTLAPEHSSFELAGQDFRVPLSAQFNVSNALAAIGAARALGVSLETAARGIATVKVPGRYEIVESDKPFSVVVDFAHTPDGLDRVLSAAKSTLQTNARLLVVVGCGGDRDRTKRPQMAEIAVRISDIAIFTSDNPRSEDPQAIVNEMLVGVASNTTNTPIVEIDRRAAIAIAISQARAGDIVVIAGKGHESGQEIAGVKTPFDDRDVARAVLSGLGAGGR